MDNENYIKEYENINIIKNMIYKCPRCGYETCVNTNFKKHIINKIICNPTITDVSLEDIKNDFL